LQSVSPMSDRLFYDLRPCFSLFFSPVCFEPPPFFQQASPSPFLLPFNRVSHFILFLRYFLPLLLSVMTVCPPFFPSPSTAIFYTTDSPDSLGFFPPVLPPPRGVSLPPPLLTHQSPERRSPGSSPLCSFLTSLSKRLTFPTDSYSSPVLNSFLDPFRILPQSSPTFPFVTREIIRFPVFFP